MGLVECCGRNQLANSYKISPADGYSDAILNVLEKCPVCGNFCLELKRINVNKNISTVKKKKNEAKNFYEKIKPRIISQIELRGKYEFC